VVRLWRSAIDDGTFIHAGELGCHQKNVPHATYLAWLDDTLEMCDRHGWGWAVWNIDGTFGILDTPRTDCKFEDFRGHKLDRKALDILIKHLPKNKANKK
jgi:endoglucanase